MQRFALFDIDGTVIRWQLFHSVVNELIRRGQLSESASRDIKQARMTWKKRENEDSFKAYEQVLVNAYLEALDGLSVLQYMGAVESVFEEYKDQTYIYTRDLIRDLKDKGYALFAVSGSQQEIVSKFAEYYGFDDAIGAHLEQLDGHFTGKIETPALGKQSAVEKLLARHDVILDGSIAVGDSESDLALFEAVEQPIVFNPSAGLFTIAKERGWSIVLERKNVIYELSAVQGQANGSYVLA
ncbi:HAD family phosphatase [Aeromicrobium sp.]|nr:HAD family phosphatase [Candidatus Saccharibacteria bacterium]